MSKILKRFCVILLAVLIVISGFFIYAHIQSARIYRAWLDDLDRISDTLPVNSYGYLRLRGQELFFLKSEDGTVACGKKDIAAGVEYLYSGNQVYTYSSQDSAPSIAAADTQQEFIASVHEIVETVQLFAGSTVKSAKLFLPSWFESSVPVLSLDSRHTVIFQLEGGTGDFHPTSDSFAHLSRKTGGISSFTYNYTTAASGSFQECLLLQIGSSDGMMSGWSGHELP